MRKTFFWILGMLLTMPLWAQEKGSPELAARENPVDTSGETSEDYRTAQNLIRSYDSKAANAAAQAELDDSRNAISSMLADSGSMSAGTAAGSANTGMIDSSSGQTGNSSSNVSYGSPL